MGSLFDELTAKLDPRLTRKSMARVDLSMLLFNARDTIAALWAAADRFLATQDPDALRALASAVDALRPIFGPR